MADCFLMPIINAAQNFPEGKEALNASGNLKKYFDQLSQRPSFSETAP
jgi:glutathione S-transferase